MKGDQGLDKTNGCGDKRKNHLDFTSVLKYITLQIVYYNKILKHAGVVLHRNLCVLSEIRYSGDYNR